MAPGEARGGDSVKTNEERMARCYKANGYDPTFCLTCKWFVNCRPDVKADTVSAGS